MRIVTPLRFVSGVVGLWIAARVAILWPGADPLVQPVAPAQAGAYHASGASHPAGAEKWIDASAETGATGENVSPSPSSSLKPSPFAEPVDFARDKLRPKGRSRGTPSSEAEKPTPAASAALGRPLDFARGKEIEKSTTPQAPAATATTQSILSPTGVVAAAPPSATPSRWSGNAYLFQRGDSGTPALATGGQLGGSQAGARIAYRLNPTGPTRVALAARISTPLNDRHGAEAAAGIDVHPLPAVPLRLSVERRVDLGGSGRNAWSAYAAGGFWRQTGKLVLDGYAQAGVVGARRRDLFADGALRAGRRAELGEGRSLTIGAGAWAAVQPGVERLDLGPRVALGFPLAGTAMTAAAEWRVRVAGDASPRTGLALTLAADF